MTRVNMNRRWSGKPFVIKANDPLFPSLWVGARSGEIPWNFYTWADGIDHVTTPHHTCCGNALADRHAGYCGKGYDLP